MDKNFQRRRFTQMTVFGLSALTVALTSATAPAHAIPPAKGGVTRAQATVATAVPGHVLLVTPASYDDVAVAALAAKAGCVVRVHIPYTNHIYLLQTTASITRAVPRSRAVDMPVQSDVATAVDILNQTPGVKASPNYFRYLDDMKAKRRAAAATVTPLVAIPNDPLYQPSTVSTTGQRWHYSLINLPQAWAIQSNKIGRTVVVADMDTGIDLTHPDLINRIQPGGRTFDQYSDPTITNPTDQPITGDSEGHGTHTAGTIAAETNNALGVSGIAGWNRSGVDVKILPLQIFGALGASDAGIIAALAYATAQKADAVSMSFGAYASDPAFAAQITASSAAGAVLVASAGNDGLDASDPLYRHYPSEYPEVIDVSAVGPSRELSYYSNYGGNIAIAAPGGDDPTFADASRMVISTYLRGAVVDGYPSSPIDGYQALQGTSMACPHVTGVVALLLAAGAKHDLATIKNILQTTATPLTSPVTTGGSQFGAGLLNAYAALKFVNSVPSTFAAQFAVIADQQSQAATSSSTTVLNYSTTLNAPYATLASTYSATQDALRIRFISGQVPVDATNAARLTISVEAITSQFPLTGRPSYVGGVLGVNDFDIVANPGTSPSDTSEIVVPRSGLQSLPAGRYKASLLYDGVAQGYVFFDINSRTEGPGLSLFSTPFVTTGLASPEELLFGKGSKYTLSRYNLTATTAGVKGQAADQIYQKFDSVTGATSVQSNLSTGLVGLDNLPLSFLQYDSAASISPVGLGFWLNVTQANPITLNIDATSTGKTVTGPVAVRLFGGSSSVENDSFTGWNLIGDPYTFSVPWGSVSVAVGSTIYSLPDAINNGILSGGLIGYRNDTNYQGYVYNVAPAGTLDPFSGYWVKAYQNCTLIIPPSQIGDGTTRAAGLSRSVSAVPAINGWRGRLMAHVSGDSDSENYFGEASEARSMANSLDILKAPPGPGHAYLRFVKADAKGRSESYAFDMRPTATTHQQSWDVRFNTDRPHADVTLTWDGLGVAPHGAEFTLTDKTTGAHVSLRNRSSYTFRTNEAGETRAFAITMTPRSSGGPLSITNVSLNGGGAAGASRAVQGISLRLATTQDADVVVVVRTLNGRKVAAFTGDSRAAALAGITLHWNGKNADGGALPMGPYLIEITARGSDGQTATVKQVYTSLR